IIDRPAKISYDFALKSTNTLVQKRGDSDDIRWIARSVPRTVLNVFETDGEEPVGESVGDGEADDTIARNNRLARHASFHGMAQFYAAASSSPAGLPAPDFFGTNVAVSGSLGGNFEVAFIGQRGAGDFAPQRVAAIATTRPSDKHQV